MPKQPWAVSEHLVQLSGRK